MLTASAARNAEHVRPAIECILTGLQRGLTLGMFPASNPVASKLLVRAGRLGKRAMTKQEIDEVGLSHNSIEDPTS